MKYFSFIVLIFIFSFALSCKKQSDNGVPITAVDIYLYSNNPSFINLTAVGGYVYITGGVRGILLYRKSNSEIMAYDRNCTYQSTQPCATVVVDQTHILAVDTCCHSKFSIYDGSVTQGPASLPLKAYQTTFDGNVLHIYN
ncbi:MAG: Rieske (2Fe-2S) protein [Bacteroidota bacterium]